MSKDLRAPILMWAKPATQEDMQTCDRVAREPRRKTPKRLLWTILPAVVFGTTLAGCGSVPGPFGSGRLLGVDRKLDTESEAFKEAVLDDPFPAAGQGNAVRVAVR